MYFLDIAPHISVASGNTDELAAGITSSVSHCGGKRSSLLLRLFPGAGQQVFQQFRDDEQARPAVLIGAAGFVRRAEGADAGPLF